MVRKEKNVVVMASYLASNDISKYFVFKLPKGMHSKILEEDCLPPKQISKYFE